MTSQTPQEKKCDHPRSHTIHYCTKCHKDTPPQPKEYLAQEEKVYFAPTPTMTIKVVLSNKPHPSKPKKTETWEERWQKFIEELSSRQDNIGKMLAVSVIFKEEIGNFISQEITTASKEAVREERENVLQEIAELIRFHRLDSERNAFEASTLNSDSYVAGKEWGRVGMCDEILEGILIEIIKNYQSTKP